MKFLQGNQNTLEYILCLYLQDTAGVVADMVDDMGNNLKGIAPEGIGNMMNKLF